MARLSLFNDYNQKENRTTNYCGLMLKLLYEESPLRFENLLNNLVEEDQLLTIGAKFEQQKRKGNSVSDMQIVQSSFQILFETKNNTNSFSIPQILHHLHGFDKDYKTKILFLLSDSVIEKRREEKRREEKRRNCWFWSFERRYYSTSSRRVRCYY